MRASVPLVLAMVALLAPFASASHVEDLERDVAWGCARQDCIPAIDEPRFDDGAWLRDEDRVLGIVEGGEARAYPVRILNWHEIVNDDVGGVPIVVTYCPLCATGLTFERTVANETTSFGVSGRLYKNDLVMYDRATGSLWSQEIGEAIWGARHGERLTFIPTSTTSWGEWRAAHPGSTVLARPDTYPAWRYDQYPYGNYEDEVRTLFPVENPSNALPAKEWVLGVFTDDASAAYREADVESRRLIRDTLDGRELVVVWVDGAPRARWADTGELPRQVHGFWFAWHDFHPETRVWGRLLASVVRATPEDPVTRVVFSEPVRKDLVLSHVPEGVQATWADEKVLALTGEGEFTLPAGAYGYDGTQLLDPLRVSLAVAEPTRTVPGIGALLVVLIVAGAPLLARRRR